MNKHPRNWKPRGSRSREGQFLKYQTPREARPRAVWPKATTLDFCVDPEFSPAHGPPLGFRG